MRHQQINSTKLCLNVKKKIKFITITECVTPPPFPLTGIAFENKYSKQKQLQ